MGGLNVTALSKAALRVARRNAFRTGVPRVSVRPTVTSARPRSLDWSNAEEGPPGLDWGISAMILAQVAVDIADSRADMAHAILVFLLAHQPDGPSALTDEGLVEAARRRAANPTMTAREVELIEEAGELVRSLTGRG